MYGSLDSPPLHDVDGNVYMCSVRAHTHKRLPSIDSTFHNGSVLKYIDGIYLSLQGTGLKTVLMKEACFYGTGSER